MTITYTIPGTTLLDQLADATMDGLPDENANDNCVPTSVAEGLHILTDKVYDGDELKDAVYGQGWTGFQSAARYVAYCSERGVTLAPHNDTQAGLVATIHAQVDAGHPVIVTMPSQWGTAPADPVHPSGSTHVGLAVGTGPGELRVMNPWHGFYQDQSDAWWQARLCEGQVWPMQKSSGGATAMSGVPAVAWSDTGSVLTAPNGKTCGHGIRAHIMGESWPAELWPVTAEEWDAVGVHQDFRNGGDADAAGRRLTWHDADNSITESALPSPAVGLQSQLSAAQTAEASAQSAAQSAQASAASLNTQLVAANSQIAQLQQQIATLQSQPAPTPPTPTPAPAPVANPAPTTIPDAAALLVTLITAEVAATIKAATPTA